MNRFRIWLCISMFCGAASAEPRLLLEPRELRGVPGEPLRAELTVETEKAVPLRLLVPATSNLLVRTVERIPIRRTETGRFVQKRVVIWQGLEAGTMTLTQLTADLGGTVYRFPEIRIRIESVDAAQPPETEGGK